MSPTDPVTHWITQLKEGDRAAVQPLWERYFQQLIRLARLRLQATSRRVIDEEDVALSAFDSFCRAAEQGRLPQLLDRDSLWAHLFVITVRKAYVQVRRDRTRKRGGGKVVNASALDGCDGEPTLLEVLGREPTPEFAAQVAEEYRSLLDRLPSDDFRAVAQWKLEGYTHDEIARKLGRSGRTVERMAQLIRGHCKIGGEP